MASLLSASIPNRQALRRLQKDLAAAVDKLSTKKFLGCGVGAPGRIERKSGTARFGNLNGTMCPG